MQVPAGGLPAKLRPEWSGVFQSDTAGFKFKWQVRWSKVCCCCTQLCACCSRAVLPWRPDMAPAPLRSGERPCTRTSLWTSALSSHPPLTTTVGAPTTATLRCERGDVPLQPVLLCVGPCMPVSVPRQSLGCLLQVWESCYLIRGGGAGVLEHIVRHPALCQMPLSCCCPGACPKVC